MSVSLKTFNREDLKDMFYGESEVLELIEKNFSCNTRWSIHYDIIFKDIPTGKFYQTTTFASATESQDKSAFEYSNPKIDCEEVYQKGVVRKEWRKVCLN